MNPGRDHDFMGVERLSFPVHSGGHLRESQLCRAYMNKWVGASTEGVCPSYSSSPFAERHFDAVMATVAQHRVLRRRGGTPASEIQ